MPRERIRREIEPQSERTYIEKEQSLKEKSKISNTMPWSGVERQTLKLSPAETTKYSGDFRTAVDGLKNLADFQKKTSLVGQWQAKARRCRGDLPGFWNDFKHELGCRIAARSEMDTTRLNRALDLLELAEQRGGLGTWLEEWNVVLTRKEGWSWDILAESAEKIRRGIEFCKAMVNEGIERSRRDDPFTAEIREQLHLGLDAIASEVARQASEIFSGGVDAGRILDGVAERLKEISPRAAIAEHLHTAFEAGTPHQQWHNELPASLSKVVNVNALSARLENWIGEANEVRDLATIIGSGTRIPEEEQAHAGRVLNDVTVAFHQEWRQQVTQIALNKNNRDNTNTALHVYWQMAKEIVARQKLLAEKLESVEARKILLGEKSGVGYLTNELGKAGAFEADLVSEHYFAELYAHQGKLGSFWRERVQGYLAKEFGEAGGNYNRETADALGQAFKADLGKLLDTWIENTEPGQRRKIGWEIIATLRNHRESVKRILDVPVTRRFYDHVVAGLDAISDVIAAQVNPQ